MSRLQDKNVTTLTPNNHGSTERMAINPRSIDNIKTI